MSKTLNGAVSIMVSVVLSVALVPVLPAARAAHAATTANGLHAAAVVPQAASGVKMLGSLTLSKGKTRTLQIDNVSDSNKTWTSSNPKVASVKTANGKGVVTGKKAGTVTIIVNCKTIGKKYGVTLVVKDPKAIALNRTGVTLQKGKKAKLKLKNAKASKVTWKSKNKKVATVSKKGVVKARKAGKTKVIARYKHKKYTCKVIVKNKVATLKALKSGVKTVTAKAGANTTIGTLASDGYQVTIPAGAFDSDTQVRLTVQGNRIDLSVPGASCVRLNEMATVKMALTGPVANADIDSWRGVYSFGDQAHLIDPDIAQLRRGVLQYQVAYFTQAAGGMATQAAGEQTGGDAQQGVRQQSLRAQAGLASWFGGKKLTDAERRAAVAYRDAVNDFSKDCQHDIAQKFVEECFGAAADQLGLAKGDPGRDKIMKQLGKSSDLFALVRAARDGDESAFAGKATEMLTKAIVSDADGTKVGYLGAAASSLPGVLDDVKKGDYTAASARVAKAVTGNIPYVKQVQFAAALTEITIDYYVDSETEAAYQAYRGQLKNGAYGYDSARDVAWLLVSKQMGAPLRQMQENAIRAYAQAHGIAESAMSEADRENVRAIVQSSLISQWDKRAANEAKIEARQAETLAQLKWFDDAGLLARGDASVGFGADDDYELRLTRLLRIRDSISALMGGKTYAELAKVGENTFGSKAAVDDYNREQMAKLVALYVENGWTKGKNGATGRLAVAKRLAEQFGLGVSLQPGTAHTMTVPPGAKGATETFALAGAYSAPKWSSSKPAVATVNAKGVVTALKPGKATISAKYGSKTYSCALTVVQGADEKIVISSNSMTLRSTSVGNGISLYKIVDGDYNWPVDVAVDASAWQVTGDTSCISYRIEQVSSHAGYIVTVRAVENKRGSAYVTCTYGGQTYTCTVNVDTIA